MGIREELSKVIYGAINKDEDMASWIYATEMKVILDAVLDRYAIIELRNPSVLTEGMDGFHGIAEWASPLGRVGVFDDGDAFVDTESACMNNVSAEDLSGLAAALLSAAKHAEGNA